MTIAASVTNSGGSNTSSATHVVTAGAAFAVGDYVVVCIGADNNGSNGANSISSVTDAAGNTYTLAGSGRLNDPGAAAAGVSTRIYYAKVTTALASGDNITVNYSPNTTAKSVAVWKVTVAAGKVLSFIAEDGVTGATANPSRTTPSITNGDLIVAALGAESSGTVTGDSDTTNGNWSSATTAQSGGTMLVSTQAKVVTATATQTYNVTLTAADWAISIAQFREADIPVGGLLGWWEADSGLTGSPTISAWASKVGSLSASQGTGANQPTINATAFPTGAQGIDFDGSDDFMTVTTSFANLVPTATAEQWAVFIPDDLQNTQSAGKWWWDDTIVGDTGGWFSLTYITGPTFQHHQSDASDHVVTQSMDGVGSVNIVRAQHSGGNITVSVNNAADAGDVACGTNGGSASTAFEFGRNYTGAGTRQYTNMKLGALLFYNRILSADEKTTVWNYLNNKYRTPAGKGIPTNPPARRPSLWRR